MTSRVTVEAVNGDVTVKIDTMNEEEIKLNNGDVIGRDHYETTTCIVKDGEKREWHVWAGGPSIRVEENVPAVTKENA